MSHQHGPGCNHGPSNGGAPQTIQVNDANKAPALFKNTATYLKDEKKSGLKARQGVFNGKRFEYFKGNIDISFVFMVRYTCINTTVTRKERH